VEYAPYSCFLAARATVMALGAEQRARMLRARLLEGRWLWAMLGVLVVAVVAAVVVSRVKTPVSDSFGGGVANAIGSAVRSAGLSPDRR
jgi:hypothetical protein